MNTAISTPEMFTFQESHKVRTVKQANELWFVAKDIFAVLGVYWAGVRSLALIPEAWRVVVKLTTTQNNQHGTQENQLKEVHCINFKGLCKIAFRSNKPEADAFTNWAAEVIDTVMKTGSYTAPQAPVEKREYLTNNDMLNLKRLVWLVSHQMKYKDSFAHAAWYCLRDVTGVPSPARFEVQHLPAMAQEFERIMGIVKQYTDAQNDAEINLIKHCIRQKNIAVLPRLLDDIKKAANVAQMKIQLETDKFFSADCLKLLNRGQAGSAVYEGYNEPKLGLDDQLHSFQAAL